MVSELKLLRCAIYTRKSTEHGLELEFNSLHAQRESAEAFIVSQQHEGWVSETAIRAVADLLDMPYIRVLEVATFYTMFQLQPVGKKAHVQVCGTTPCRLRGAGDIIEVCQSRIHHDPFHLSKDGNFSWEEVECLGACVNAPMVLIWKDTYEDLNKENFGKVLDGFASGNPPKPGPQIDRQFSAPVGGPTTLKETT